MEAPRIPSMFGFKSKKPNQFYFEPRYYDEQKEKMLKRYDRIAREVTNKPSFERLNSEDFKSTLRENWGTNYNRAKAGNKMNTRVIIYVIALVALAYYILF
ncbi:MAG: hypothetical protein COA97_02415 [Flavobacteriales bacterium]|nr:MAG: hypothetical protein COA97_02415 [Flavobacteriales bacterium]